MFSIREKPERVTWSVDNFQQMIRAGIVKEKSGEFLPSWVKPSNRVAHVMYTELIQGEVVRLTREFYLNVWFKGDPSIAPPANTGVEINEEQREWLTQHYRSVFGEDFRIWLKQPLSIDINNRLLPRFAVTFGADPPHHTEQTNEGAVTSTTNVVLVVEYSTDTLSFGRASKAEIYAMAGIPEYWIYRVKDRVLEVHRDPVKMQERYLKYGYRITEQYSHSESIVPLSAVNSSISVSDI